MGKLDPVIIMEKSKTEEYKCNAVTGELKVKLPRVPSIF